GETYTVNDSWLVGATKPEGVTDEQAKQIRDNCKFHQDAIRTALLSGGRGGRAPPPPRPPGRLSIGGMRTPCSI
uniref:hypothetical protein n=1 Tax=Nocardia otitidiscaviarum TaxID=1823 RepID=UPI002457D599